MILKKLKKELTTQFNITLKPSLVKRARDQLETGQKLSPIIAELIEQWIKDQNKKRAFLQDLQNNLEGKKS